MTGRKPTTMGNGSCLSRLNIPGHALPVTAHRLGRQDKLVPAALNGLADQLLADAVAPGGVDEIDIRLLGIKRKPNRK